MDESTSSIPYNPSPFLLSNSVFTSDQLIAYFEDFRSALQFVAPELAFERLVGNLNESLKDALNKDQNATAKDHSTLECYEQILHKETQELPHTDILTSPESSALPKCSSAATSSKVARTRSNPQSDSCGKSVQVSFPYDVLDCGITSFTSLGLVAQVVPIGISRLEIDSRDDVDSYCTQRSGSLDTDDFTIIIKSTHDLSELTNQISPSNVRFSGLGIGCDDPDFQHGTYSTLDDSCIETIIVRSYKDIKFHKAYDIAPVVLVWFTGLGINQDGAFRVRTKPENITTTGFRVFIEAWDSTFLHMANVEWIAFTADIPRVCRGELKISDERRIDPSMTRDLGFREYGMSVSNESPPVFLTINYISKDDVWISSGLRSKTSASSISVAKMSCCLDARTGFRLCGMGVSYIALA